MAVDLTMSHMTIYMNDNTSRENENIVMIEREQEDLEQHDHKFFELAYITGGTCMHTLNTTKTVLHRGDYFFVDLGSTHRYENSNGLKLINCLFMPETINGAMRDCRSLNKLFEACLMRYYRLITGVKWADRIFHDDDGRIGTLLNDMVREYREMQFGSAEIFYGKMTEIIILTLRKLVSDQPPRITSETVSKAILYIKHNHARNITLREFCTDEHYSVPYVSRRFHEETGLTFSEYLQRTRIEKSCELLAGSDCSVLAAANSSGYEDIRSFNAAFRRHLGMTPTEYRRLSRKQLLIFRNGRRS